MDTMLTDRGPYDKFIISWERRTDETSKPVAAKKAVVKIKRSGHRFKKAE